MELKTCSHCGTVARHADAMFCHQCGQKLPPQKKPAGRWKPKKHG